jgi:ribonuclease HII
MPLNQTNALLEALTDLNNFGNAKLTSPAGFRTWDFRGPILWTPGGMIGVDEAGRGAWAGPVVVAAVWWPHDENDHKRNRGLNDSKKLSPAAREREFGKITQEARAYAIVEADHHAVDRMNVRAATLEAMSLAVDLVLGITQGDHDDTAEQQRIRSEERASILIDGDAVPPAWAGIAQSLVRGDSLEPAIMAASILAKTARDRWMRNVAHLKFPEFSFDAHKGYGVPVHQEALRIHGPTAIHRLTFAPVKASLAQHR